MTPQLREFLSFLDTNVDEEYGDFKRDADLHLLQLMETRRQVSPLTQEEFDRLRYELLWRPHEDEDIEPMKKYLRQKAQELFF